jgi:hypothetical protein
MLSPTARALLRIPDQIGLPESLAELYDRWFVGRSYETRFSEGWAFGPRGHVDIPFVQALLAAGYAPCLEHRTAQFWFALDSSFRVYVQCENWIPIASSFVSLVEQDAVLVDSIGRGEERRGFGCFSSFDEFVSKNSDYLAGFQELPSPDPEFSRFYRGPQSTIGAGRFYSDEYQIGALEYF